MPPLPGRPRRGPRTTTLLLAAALGAGCGRAASPPAPPVTAPVAASAEECILRPPGQGSAVSLDSALRVAVDSGYAGLFDPARRHTPTTLSCAGEARPGLATSWSGDSSGRAWTLVLGDTTGGSPSAAELAAGWRERPEAAEALQWAGALSVLPLDMRRLVVTFEAPHDSLPAVFADPALASSSVAADPWPMRVTVGAGADLRDALDAGAGLVVTADADVLEYASSGAATALAALPWSRTYVLLIPPGSAGLDVVGRDSAAFRAALARDAVRAAARGAEPPYWWERASECAPAPARTASRTSSVVYPREDPVARALAERVVALAGSAGVAARGAARWELSHAVATGADAGYVVPLPRVALVPCRELASWPAGSSVLPLVDTRATAVLRAGAPPLRVAWDGALAPVELP